MATVAQMRAIALALPEATEKPHFKDAGFYVRKKMFASVSDETKQAVVGLGRELMEQLIAAQPKTFSQYGRGPTSAGATVIELGKIEKAELQRLVALSWKSVAPKALIAEYEKKTK